MGLEGASVGVELVSSTLLDRELSAVRSTVMGAPNWTGIPLDDDMSLVRTCDVGSGRDEADETLSIYLSALERTMAKERWVVSLSLDTNSV